MNLPPVSTRTTRNAAAAGLAVMLLSAVVLSGAGRAHAAGPTILLGTSQEFAVLGGAGVTNTGSTTIDMAGAGVRGDVGTFPDNSIVGKASVSWLSPSGGGFREADAVAQIAQADSLTAYGTAAGAPSTSSLGAQLDTLQLGPGVHTASSALNLASNGTVVLDAAGDPDAEFVIQVGSSLTIESGATVRLTGGAQACRVFWQVSEDATIGVGATFVGTLLAENAIVAQSAATFTGRLLAQNASVTLDNNTFVLPACAAAQGGGGTGGGGGPVPGPTTGPAPGGGNGGGGSPGTSTPRGGDSGRDDDSSSDTDTDTDTVSTSGSGSGSGTSTSSLPDTGGVSLLLPLAGAALVVAGAAVAAGSRTSRSGTHRAGRS